MNKTKVYEEYIGHMTIVTAAAFCNCGMTFMEAVQCRPLELYSAQCV